MSIHKDENTGHITSHNTNSVGDNIAKFRKEGISHDQAVAKSLSMAGIDSRGRPKKK